MDGVTRTPAALERDVFICTFQSPLLCCRVSSATAPDQVTSSDRRPAFSSCPMFCECLHTSTGLLQQWHCDSVFSLRKYLEASEMSERQREEDRLTSPQRRFSPVADVLNPDFKGRFSREWSSVPCQETGCSTSMAIQGQKLFPASGWLSWLCLTAHVWMFGLGGFHLSLCEGYGAKPFASAFRRQMNRLSLPWTSSPINLSSTMTFGEEPITCGRESSLNFKIHFFKKIKNPSGACLFGFYIIFHCSLERHFLHISV